jgi:hypothetical protein
MGILQVLTKLATMYPNLLLTEFIEAIIDPLDKTINKKSPAGAPGASSAAGGTNAANNASAGGDGPSNVELDRQAELSKSALRVCVAINNSCASVCALVRRWVEFMDRLSKQAHTAQLLQQIAADRLVGDV